MKHGLVMKNLRLHEYIFLTKWRCIFVSDVAILCIFSPNVIATEQLKRVIIDSSPPVGYRKWHMVMPLPHTIV